MLNSELIVLLHAVELLMGDKAKDLEKMLKEADIKDKINMIGDLKSMKKVVSSMKEQLLDYDKLTIKAMQSAMLLTTTSNN